MPTPTYTKAGVKAATNAKLPKGIFDLEVKSHDLLKQAYTAYLSNGRTNNAHVLKRGEVSGGGRKPWKQKGTGRARFGSIRVPIWRGGGITFGPTGNENYMQTMPTKTKRQAIRQALSVKTENISVIETFECKDAKTSSTAKLLSKIGATKKILLVVSVKDELVNRATRNIQDLKVVQARYLNVFDILNADSIIISEKSLAIIEEWLAPTSAAATKGKKSS